MSTEILVALDIIPRTVEIARLFGCEYDSVG